MITVIKKIIIVTKEKVGKRQGKKTLVRRVSTVCSNSTVLPLRHNGSHALILQKALI